MSAGATAVRPHASAPRLWPNLWVRLAVALAFADASIVVLALPQIVDRLHTSISHVVWVIVGYNLALIVGSLAILPLARRVATTGALIGGLVLFGLASLGCGAAGSLSVLVLLRCIQGFGGALILAASLPMFAGVARPGDSPLFGWSAAAAVGAAVGPAAGGVLTQVFDWRSIFFAQAPVAAFAALAVLLARPRSVDQLPPAEPDAGRVGSRLSLDPLTANAGLTLLSAGLIGALFLVVIELINAWLVTPLGAAAIVSTIPLATAVAERAVRGVSPVLLAIAGSLLLAGGLLVLQAVPHRELGLVVLALALCGTGIGFGLPGLTAAALASTGSAAARAAKTVAARDAGLVLGLLLLTPMFVAELDKAPNRATAKAAGELLVAPIPPAMKLELVPELESAVNHAPQSRPPDLGPAFDKVGAGASPQVRAQLAALEARLNAIIQDAVTSAFTKPLRYAALLSLLVLPLLALRAAVVWLRRRPPGDGR